MGALGHGVVAGLPGISTVVSPVGPGWAGRQARRCGGRWTAACSVAQAGSQGQLAGRCRVTRRAERAIRAGTLIRWARIVDVVARAWPRPARVPAARVRLCAV